MPQPTSGLPSETRPRAEPPETEPPGTGSSDRPAGPVPFTQAVRTDTLGDERTDMAAGKPVEPVEPVEPAAPAAPGPDKPRAVRERTVGVLLEVLAAVVVVGVFLVWCRVIKQNPLDRVSQVSGMAKVDFRFLVIGFLVVAAAVAGDRFGPPVVRRHIRPMACAAVAALSTAIVAGGVLFALHGTRYGILAGGSDFGWIQQWVDQFYRTGSFPSYYPPLPIYLFAALTKISGQPVAIVSKPYEIVGTALFGPVAYFSWRLLLRPIWALAVGVVAMLPFIEPFKVYPHLVLVAFVPVTILFLSVVRRCDGYTRRKAAGVGAAFGLGFALLFLSYSGWFVWTVPGALAAFALVAPWRRAVDRALLLAGTALVVFVPLTWVHLTGLLSPNGGTSDNYMYFDTRTDPAYIAMWRNDSGANVGPTWPPLGELGNVGLFSVLLVAGLALALALGWRRTTVIACCGVMAGAWLLRFYLAGQMYATGKVQLYPRTTVLILYCLLVLIGYTIYLATDRIRELYRRLRDDSAPGRGVPFGLMLAPLLLLFLFVGSATMDRLMPADKPGTDNYPIWISHTTPLPDGSCPVYGRGPSCAHR